MPATDTAPTGKTSFDAPTRGGHHRTAPGTGKPSNAKAGAIYRQEHPDYCAKLAIWQKIRTVLRGPDAVKDEGTKYLPSLHEQEATDYERFKARAVWVAYTSRTLSALVGLLMRKTPESKFDGVGDEFAGDVDLQGTTLNDYIRNTNRELAAMGRGGTMIDWSKEESRPYWAFYEAETITNWNVGRVNGRMMLTLLTLKEEGFAINETTLEHEALETFRVYRLLDGVVQLEVTKVQAGAEGMTETTVLKRRGKALTAIPFIFHTLKGNKAEVYDAPMEDMAEINLSHYRTSADLENGRHLAGLPTPYAFGFDPEEDLIMGTTHAWISDRPEAKVGFLEFTGAGLSELRDALKEKQEQMAILGARMLQPEKEAAEAYGTVKLRADAEQSTLVNVAEASSATLSLALQMAAWWKGTQTKPGDTAEQNFIVLPTDFVAAKIAGPEFTAFVSGLQQGAISWPTFFYNLQQGEIYPEGWTKEDEEAALQQAPVVTPPVADDPNKPDPNKKPDPKKEPEAGDE